MDNLVQDLSYSVRMLRKSPLVATAAVFSLAIGIGGGALLGHFARGLLFGTGSTDVTTYLVASLVIVLSALLAGFLPARRASTIDPMTALRYS